VLPKPPRDMTEAILREGCREHWPESQTLDFKRDLPAVDDGGRNEFLKDVCALANADGGDLVYGIAERDGAAGEPTPIVGENVDAVRRRLTQIADAGLEPRVSGISMGEVAFADGGFVLIVRVPASFDAPHRYRREAYTRFVVRNGTVTSDMTYDQIRTAFDRSATLAERAREFRLKRCEAIAAGGGWRPLAPGPIAAVHLIPLSALSGRTSVDVAALHDGDYAAFAQTRPRWGHTTRTLNLDGIVVHPLQEPGAQVLAFSQVFRSGCLESVRNVRHTVPPPEHLGLRGVEIIPAAVLATFVHTMVQAFARGAVLNGFLGPAVLGVSLLRVGNVRLGLGDRYRQNIALAADRSNLLTPETWIPALDGLVDVDPVVRPILDILWQCFDEPKCLQYDANGRWTEAVGV
jgi:hypothetical protein